jgi:serine/threonine protein kinase
VSAPVEGSSMQLEDFNYLAVIGRGSYGKVLLAERKTTRQLYAIKTKKKTLIEEKDRQGRISVEKRVFLIAKKECHPFFVNLYACFQTDNRFYFVMEYVVGGDLMFLIQKGPLREEQILYLPGFPSLIQILCCGNSARS